MISGYSSPMAGLLPVTARLPIPEYRSYPMPFTLIIIQMGVVVKVLYESSCRSAGSVWGVCLGFIPLENAEVATVFLKFSEGCEMIHESRIVLVFEMLSISGSAAHCRWMNITKALTLMVLVMLSNLTGWCHMIFILTGHTIHTTLFICYVFIVNTVFFVPFFKPVSAIIALRYDNLLEKQNYFNVIMYV